MFFCRFKFMGMPVYGFCKSFSFLEILWTDYQKMQMELLCRLCHFPKILHLNCVGQLQADCKNESSKYFYCFGHVLGMSLTGSQPQTQVFSWRGSYIDLCLQSSGCGISCSWLISLAIGSGSMMICRKWSIWLFYNLFFWQDVTWYWLQSLG